MDSPSSTKKQESFCLSNVAREYLKFQSKLNNYFQISISDLFGVSTHSEN